MKKKVYSFLTHRGLVWKIISIFLILFAINIYLGFRDESLPEKIVYSDDYEGYPYLLYTPVDYDKNPYKKWPLIVYLHGASLRGTDTNLLKKYGLPDLIERGEQFDFIIASPQCPPGKTWINDDWFPPFYNNLTQKYRIDSTRIYLTGMSMGGFGTWYIGAEYQEYFAAIAPLCGGGNPDDALKYKDVAVWAVHGTKDRIVPLKRSQEMVTALETQNHDVRFTKLKGEGHGIQDFYEEKKLYRWFLMHRKK